MTSGDTRWSSVGFGLALASLAAYQLFKLPPALPVMLDAYGYDRVLAGGFMSIFAVAGIALSIRVGRGLERRGPWPYLAAAFALYLAGEALALAAPANGWLVLAARGLEGAGFTVCAIAGPLIANLGASPRHLPLVIGLTATWIPVGQLTAGLISLPVVAQGEWRPLWWIGIALTLALAAWALRLRARGTVDIAGRPTESRGAGGATADEHRALVVAGAIFAVFTGQYFGYMTWLPAYLVENLGFSAETAVFAYIMPTVTVIVFNLATGAVLRAGMPLTPLLAGSIAVQSMVWLSIPLVGGGWAGAASLVVYGVASGIAPACLFALPSTILGAGRVDAGAFGIIMTGRNLGVLAGPVVLAQAVTATAGWSLVWPIYGGATLAAAMGAVYLGGRLRNLPSARGG